MQDKKMVSLWSYNPITGYWVLERNSGYPETMRNWLRIYQADAPDKAFKLTERESALLIRLRDMRRAAV